MYLYKQDHVGFVLELEAGNMHVALRITLVHHGAAGGLACMVCMYAVISTPVHATKRQRPNVAARNWQGRKCT